MEQTGQKNEHLAGSIGLEHGHVFDIISNQGQLIQKEAMQENIGCCGLPASTNIRFRYMFGRKIINFLKMFSIYTYIHTLKTRFKRSFYEPNIISLHRFTFYQYFKNIFIIIYI